MLNLFGLKKDLRMLRRHTFFQYNTVEQFTGKYDTDGRKIYCKVFKGNNLTLAYDMGVTINILNIYGFVDCAYDNTIAINSYFIETGYMSFVWLYAKRYIHGSANDFAKNRPYWFNIEYTKTNE